MLLWAAAATIALVISILLFHSYRRQVRKTCRQLRFIKKHKTNLRLTSSLPFSELNELTDDINQIIDHSHEIENTAQKNETDLKETITNLSHDIRTPLTSMDGYIQLLHQSTSAEEQAHYFNVIQSRVAVLKEMLEELFTYTKLQNEAYTLQTESLDFGKCVRETLFSFYDEFQNKGIEPKILFSDDPLPITGNEEALHRIIQNIIKNALLHGCGDISLALTGTGSEAVFCCSNGVRHSEKIDTAKIFSQFYKADPARTNTSSGLGLSIAKGLTERMNGTISAAVREDLFTIEVRFPLDKHL